MITPKLVNPDDDVRVVGRVFSTQLVIKGWTWLPLSQLIAWGIMTRLAGQADPDRSLGSRLRIGAVTANVILAMEWCHNLAHAAAAYWVGKPVDAIRVILGLPLLVYFRVNDPEVKPREHLIRALGGPIFNLIALPISYLLKSSLNRQSTAGQAARAAVGMNAFLAIASFLPLPVLDGGPILKWSLISRGKSLPEAEKIVQRVNGYASGVLSGLSLLAVKRGHKLIGLLGLLTGLQCLSFALGWIRERE